MTLSIRNFLEQREKQKGRRNNMAEKKYFRCSNISRCDLAKKRERIVIGDGSEFVCPAEEENCREHHLKPCDPPPNPIAKFVPPVLAGLGVLAVVAGASWFLTSAGPPTTGPEAVQQALTEVWPWLKEPPK